MEKYLSKCVDSVLAQTYKDLEIILVDDGSTDESSRICDEYAAKDDRIRVIHKENGGLSDARNAGLDIATGGYVVFIDSDDFYYDQNCLADIADNVEKCESDLVLIPCIHFFDEKEEYRFKDKKYDNSKIAGNSKKDALLYAMKYDAFKACACDKVVKRSVIEKNGIRFSRGVISEDIDWTARLVLCCDSFSCLERPIYVYRQRGGSITHSVGIKHVKDIMKQINELLKIECDETDEYLLRTYLAHNYVMLVESYLKAKERGKRKIYRSIKELRFLLNYDASRNVSLVKRVYRMFGYNVMLLSLKLFRT